MYKYRNPPNNNNFYNERNIVNSHQYDSNDRTVQYQCHNCGTRWVKSHGNKLIKSFCFKCRIEVDSIHMNNINRKKMKNRYDDDDDDDDERCEERFVEPSNVGKDKDDWYEKNGDGKLLEMKNNIGYRGRKDVNVKKYRNERNVRDFGRVPRNRYPVISCNLNSRYPVMYGDDDEMSYYKRGDEMKNKRKIEETGRKIRREEEGKRRKELFLKKMENTMMDSKNFGNSIRERKDRTNVLNEKIETFNEELLLKRKKEREKRDDIDRIRIRGVEEGKMINEKIEEDLELQMAILESLKKHQVIPTQIVQEECKITYSPVNNINAVNNVNVIPVITREENVNNDENHNGTQDEQYFYTNNNGERVRLEEPYHEKPMNSKERLFYLKDLVVAYTLQLGEVTDQSEKKKIIQKVKSYVKDIRQIEEMIEKGKKMKNEKKDKSTRKENTNTNTNNNNGTCKICLHNIISIVLDCGHTYCKECSSKVEKKCFFCKSNIRSKRKIFI